MLSDDHLVALFELVQILGHIDLDVVNAHVVDHFPILENLVNLTNF